MFKSFVGILMRTFPFFHNLAILFSEIVGNKTSCRPLRSIIILVINKSDKSISVLHTT